MSNIRNKLKPRTWRSKKSQEDYKAFRTNLFMSGECPLCSVKIKQEFKHWIIVKNKFPYDAVARTHDLIVSKRHVGWNKLSKLELAELKKLKETYLCQNYSFLLEAFAKDRSVPNHYHLHLINPKLNC